MGKVYQLIRRDGQGNVKVLSVSNSRSYVNRRMTYYWEKDLEKAKREDPTVGRCWFAGEYAKIDGVAEWFITTVE